MSLIVELENGLADRVLAAEQVGDHRLAEHDDAMVVGDVRVREEAADGHAVAASRAVAGRGADELARLVARAVWTPGRPNSRR